MFIWKNAMKKTAAEWTTRVQQVFPENIIHSVSNAQVVKDYTIPFRFTENKYDTVVSMLDLEVEKAVHEIKTEDNRLCVLNFAYYLKPAESSFNGGVTQEASICHSSTLAPVLDNFSKEYAARKDRQNNGFYKEDFIYTPNILFFDENRQFIKADVLTYAAPNMKKKPKTPEYYRLLRERIVNAYVYPSLQGADTLVLGAWGCGECCNDADTVASMFVDTMNYYPGLYKQVVYTVPIDKDHNNEAFKKHINSKTDTDISTLV